jgi:hypothetical protein
LTKPEEGNGRSQARQYEHGHGGWFRVTGVMHVTTDDLFILMEMAVRKEEKMALEKETKLRQSHQAKEEKALASVAQGKSDNSLYVAHLDMLLLWHWQTKYNSGWHSGWMRMKKGVLGCRQQKLISATHSVRMLSDCCLRGIKPCEWKGKGYQWVGNRVFRLGSRKELRKE